MITFRHGDRINILGRSWLIDFLKADDAEFYIVDEKAQRFLGLAMTTQHGGVIEVVIDQGDPQQTLVHEICEAFLTEMERQLHEKGGD